MITIEKKNGMTILTVTDRLDTTTAPELDKMLDAALNGTQELIFNMTNLEYISSAGLRVLLKAQKMMDTQGNMKLIGVRESVMEIFDVTGFTDILTIE